MGPRCLTASLSEPTLGLWGSVAACLGSHPGAPLVGEWLRYTAHTTFSCHQPNAGGPKILAAQRGRTTSALNMSHSGEEFPPVHSRFTSTLFTRSFLSCARILQLLFSCLVPSSRFILHGSSDAGNFVLLGFRCAWFSISFLCAPGLPSWGSEKINVSSFLGRASTRPKSLS